MPVINLMNIPKNNLVFSLHVLRYTSGAHGAHVALQERTTSMSVTHPQISQDQHPHAVRRAFNNFPMATILLPTKISPAISGTRSWAVMQTEYF